MARVKTEIALVPVHRKELRKVFLENLQWMPVMKKDPTFKKVMETQKELKDSEGFDQIKTRPTMNVTEFFVSWIFVSIIAFQ